MASVPSDAAGPAAGPGGREPRRVKVAGSLFRPVLPEDAVYVGRGGPGLKASPYANPFAIRRKFDRNHPLRRILDAAVLEVCSPSAPDLDRAHYDIITPATAAVAVAAYRIWLSSQPGLTERARADLAGRDLACWCDLPEAAGEPDLCHAAWLLDVANDRTKITRKETEL
jgi:hypothetical protein